MNAIFESILGAGKKTYLVAIIAIAAIGIAVAAPKFLPITDSQAAAVAVQACVAGTGTMLETTPEEIQMKADASAKCQEIDDKPLTPMSAIMFALGFLGLIFLKMGQNRTEATAKAIASTTGSATKPPGS